MEKIQTRTAQMNKTEWDKCKDGQRFKAGIITNAKKKVTLEDIMDKLERIETRLDNLEARIDDIVKINNLKESKTPSLQ